MPEDQATIEQLQRRIGELEERLAGLEEHIESRLQRHYDRTSDIGNESRDRDRDLDYRIDEAVRKANDAMDEARRAGSGSRW